MKSQHSLVELQRGLLALFRSPGSLTLGYGCAVYVGVVGARDIDIDVIYIAFIMSTQYHRVLGTVQRQGTTGQLE